MKQYIRRLSNLIQIGFWYLYQIILGRTIKVEALALRFEMQGTQLCHVLSWNVVGCYKIGIREHKITFPGNAKGVSITDSIQGPFITLIFFGVFEKVEYQIPLYQSTTGLSQKLIVSPVSFSAQLSRANLDVPPPNITIGGQEFAQGQLETVFSNSIVIGSKLTDSHTTKISPLPAEYFKENEPELTYFQ
ncbi:MAG: hypothetical protein H6576_04020 [Lewinellaceae bacterium]|nr:hypothetical protein [Saprospiraceae bacterium]MCB9342834.1 hypothetical protein [Lewinellaceae bacterium]